MYVYIYIYIYTHTHKHVHTFFTIQRAGRTKETKEIMTAVTPCAKENFPQAILRRCVCAFSSSALKYGFCIEFHGNTTLI